MKSRNNHIAKVDSNFFKMIGLCFFAGTALFIVALAK